MQNASLFGSYFLTFVIVLFNFLVAYAIRYADKRKMASVVAGVVLLTHVLCGTVLYFIPTKNEDKSITVASIQGNLESQSNYGITNSETFNIYAEQTKRAAEDGAKLIIWPEGVLPSDINTYIRPENSVKSITISSAVSNLAKKYNVTIVMGSYYKLEKDGEEKLYNCMSAFYPDGTSNIGAYAKIRLVPFGEYMPMRDFISAVVPALSQINMLSSDVGMGTESTVFDATTDENAIQIGTLICFDSIYETLAIDTSRVGAEMFIVPSNDSWFYDSRAMNMHHSQNILRAVEQGKYTVNCGNTGITSVLSDKGEIISEMPIYERGYVLDTVYANETRTLYSYVGNLFVYICIVVVVLPFVVNVGYNLYKKRAK